MENNEQSGERFVILLRHGLAEDPSPDKPDAERALTAEGHAFMKQISRGLERAMPRAQAIYSSPLLRASQTATWVSKGYRSRVAVHTTEALAPGATTDQFREMLATIGERRAIVVGHEPNLTRNLRALLGFDENEKIELEKGGCYGVRVGANGTASLEWLLPSRILMKLGE